MGPLLSSSWAFPGLLLERSLAALLRYWDHVKGGRGGHVGQDRARCKNNEKDAGPMAGLFLTRPHTWVRMLELLLDVLGLLLCPSCHVIMQISNSICILTACHLNQLRRYARSD